MTMDWSCCTELQNHIVQLQAAADEDVCFKGLWELKYAATNELVFPPASDQKRAAGKTRQNHIRSFWERGTDPPEPISKYISQLKLSPWLDRLLQFTKTTDYRRKPAAASAKMSRKNSTRSTKATAKDDVDLSFDNATGSNDVGQLSASLGRVRLGSAGTKTCAKDGIEIYQLHMGTGEGLNVNQMFLSFNGAGRVNDTGEELQMALFIKLPHTHAKDIDQHTLSICAGEGLEPVGDSAACSLLKYTFSVLSHADRKYYKDMLEHFAEGAFAYHHRQPGVDMDRIVSDNSNRKDSLTNTVQNQLVDGNIKTKTVYLRLPRCPETGQQLVTQGGAWQKEKWNCLAGRPEPGTFPMKSEKSFLSGWTNYSYEREGEVITVQTPYQLVNQMWELPVQRVSGGKGAMKTEYTPPKETDYGDRFADRINQQTRNTMRRGMY